MLELKNQDLSGSFFFNLKSDHFVHSKSVKFCDSSTFKWITAFKSELQLGHFEVRVGNIFKFDMKLEYYVTSFKRL